MTANAGKIAADEKRLGTAVAVADKLLRLATMLAGPPGFSVDSLIALSGDIDASLG